MNVCKLVLALALLATGSSFAYERVSLGFGIGGGPVYAAPCGHYETRTETVLVSPERYERVLVRPASVEVKIVNGNNVTTEVPAVYEDRRIEARYETRTVTVWVTDGYYGPYYGPYYSSPVRVGIGFGFNFGGHRR